MKSFGFYLLAALVLSSFLFSCSKNETSEDDQPPKITIYKPNNGDTIFFEEEYGVRTLFSDNEALSSYSISIYSEKSGLGRQDSTYLKYSRGFDRIFDYQERELISLITLSKLQRKDTIGVTINLPAMEGDYKFKVVCLDKAGNRDSVINEIKLYYRPVVSP